MLFAKVQRRLSAQGLALTGLTPELAERLRADLGAQSQGFGVLPRFGAGGGA